MAMSSDFVDATARLKMWKIEAAPKGRFFCACSVLPVQVY
ncbi:MAG: hypothetical protein RI953_2345, partial [Pseudomonadota bacterium]